MQSIEPTPIVMSDLDYERIERLVAAQGRRRDASVLVALRDELERAEVVDRAAVPADVVVMGSRVRFRDEASGEQEEVTLVFPTDADPARGRVSILAPIGSALIGLRLGQGIDWSFPSGVRRLRVVGVDQAVA
jgi:regulator of nucleoside diphosphate kinase